MLLCKGNFSVSSKSCNDVPNDCLAQIERLDTGWMCSQACESAASTGIEPCIVYNFKLKPCPVTLLFINNKRRDQIQLI